MKTPYLEITNRRGRPPAAYLYLDAGADVKSARTEPVGAGMLVDYAESGRPIGIEITQPGRDVVEGLNRVLRGLGLPELAEGDAAPLRAASRGRWLVGMTMIGPTPAPVPASV